jgi:hypothetical protein
MYATLVQMIDTASTASNDIKPKPTIELFDLNATATPASRIECTGTGQSTKGSKYSNFKMSKKGDVEFVANTGDPVAARYIKDLVTQQSPFPGNGKYIMDDSSACDEVWVSRSEDQTDYSECRVTGLMRNEDYWKTTWTAGASGTSKLVVKYSMSADPDNKSTAAAPLFSHHGAEGTIAGWDSMDSSYNLKWGLIARSAINSLRVRSMVLTKGATPYTLCGAHRLNFNYHNDPHFNTKTQWGSGTFLAYEQLELMKYYGLATKQLFDPLGFAWLLLWKRNLSVSSTAKYYVCAAQMHPHFADLLTGFLPEDYTACTATRFWNSDVEYRTWFVDHAKDHNPTNFSFTAIRKEMGLENTNTGTGNTTHWVADKIRKPFFTLDSDGGVANSDEITNAINSAPGADATKTTPLEKLMLALRHIYFGEDPTDGGSTTPAATLKPTATVVLVGTPRPASNAASTAASNSAVAAEGALSAAQAAEVAADAAVAANPTSPEAIAEAASAKLAAAAAKLVSDAAREKATSLAAVATAAEAAAKATSDATAVAKAKTDAEAVGTTAPAAVEETLTPMEKIKAFMEKYKIAVIAVGIFLVLAIIIVIVLASTRSSKVAAEKVTTDSEYARTSTESDAADLDL